MGTHPIFESDFDCLTEQMSEETKADVEMAETVEAAPAEAENVEQPPEEPKVKEADLPIEDIDDIEQYEDEVETKAKKTSMMIENHACTLVSNMEKLKNDKDFEPCFVTRGKGTQLSPFRSVSGNLPF